MNRILSLLLVFVLLLSLVPTSQAARVGEEAASTNSFGGVHSSRTDLLFDFGNRPADQSRYSASAYGGYNFDQETNGYWATGYNGSKTAYHISNANGTLRVNVTEDTDASGTYGPWIKVTNTYGTAPSYSAASHAYYPLSYVPENAEYFQIRLKTTDCEAIAGKPAKVVVEFYYSLDGSYAYAGDITASYAVSNGEYQVLTAPVSDIFKAADESKCIILSL